LFESPQPVEFLKKEKAKTPRIPRISQIWEILIREIRGIRGVFAFSGYAVRAFARDSVSPLPDWTFVQLAKFVLVLQKGNVYKKRAI
jgi:hypothetical protein